MLGTVIPLLLETGNFFRTSTPISSSIAAVGTVLYPARTLLWALVASASTSLVMGVLLILSYRARTAARRLQSIEAYTQRHTSAPGCRRAAAPDYRLPDRHAATAAPPSWLFHSPRRRNRRNAGNAGPGFRSGFMAGGGFDRETPGTSDRQAESLEIPRCDARRAGSRLGGDSR